MVTSPRRLRCATEYELDCSGAAFSSRDCQVRIGIVVGGVLLVEVKPKRLLSERGENANEEAFLRFKFLARNTPLGNE